MHPEHENKIKELIDSFTETLMNDCKHLYTSGGIDLYEYGTEDYRLAKVLLSAAIRRNADVYFPYVQDKPKRDVKNLISM